jgi:hypothetical protein
VTWGSGLGRCECKYWFDCQGEQQDAQLGSRCCTTLVSFSACHVSVCSLKRLG